ncbi:peptidase M22, glycoprotease [Daedalea quercina L-15889]|uniref:N(6)-L-threonylcarbamoyladenine synthase n=1 Tax=Daedalea quercina L-15889 TaxID=1314783 RepID=A0A165PJM9_9APHY|nr:peptidase M22, glycoprotease [Daedalea quercina L-15889]
MRGVRTSGAFRAISHPTKLLGKDVITILGVESSADDTCAAVVTSDRRILSNVVLRQDEYHRPLGGIQPYVAIEAHQRHLPGVVEQALQKAGMYIEDVDGIAYTRGPGMPGCLSVGSNAMKTLATALRKPLIGVNHMHAHALTPFLTQPPESRPTYPFLTLLVSGGHTMFVLAKSPRDFEVLAATQDEAIGRTVDKVARLLKIPWGDGGLGASLERYVLAGPPEGYNEQEGYEIPIYSTPMPKSVDLAFGAYHSITERFLRGREDTIDENTRYAVAKSFQRAIVRQLEDKLGLIFRQLKDDRIQIHHLVVSGGVASNSFVREGPTPVKLVFPPVSLCTDNAAMVAWASMDRFLAGESDPGTTELLPKWSIDNLDAPPNRGPLPGWRQS